MEFVKMHGCGNDYIYIDAGQEGGSAFLSQTQEKKEQQIRRICNRHFGVGADGVIFIHTLDGTDADFEMEMYNADGSTAEMCGNGILCVGRYVYEQGLTKRRELRIVSHRIIRNLWLYPDNASSVRVNMGKPEFLCRKIPVFFTKQRMIGEQVELGEKIYHMTCVSMGNPHAVILPQEDFIMNTIIEGEPFIKLPDLLQYFPYDIEAEGAMIEHAEIFPKKTNVEFVYPVDRHNICMRVWERGSGETMSCGSGGCAAVAACVINGLTKNEVTVTLLGGSLYVEWDLEADQMYLTGPVDTVYHGEIDI